MYKIAFKNTGGEDVTVFAACGENLLGLARGAGVIIDAPCSGNGTCGKCLVKVVCDGLSEWVPACQTVVTGDAVVEVRESSSFFDISIEVNKELDRDGITDSSSVNFIDASQNDNDDFQASLPPRFGLAVDIGTTTVSAMLVEIGSTGEIYAKATTGNAQIRYGADVINRIIEQQKPGGIKKLQDAIIRDTLLPLINSLCQATGVSCESIIRMVIAANTTMNHLLLGVNANSIRLEPFEPAFLRFPVYNPSDIGINLAPDAEMIIAPNVGSYVGGDITAGVPGTGPPTGWQMWPMNGELSRTIIDPETNEEVDAPNEMTLLIDLGTNGEIVFSNREFMMTCACSAGPAFEGGDISCGMRATPGAVHAFKINDETNEPELSVIGNGKPSGICGSGIIDVISELFRKKIINKKGKFEHTGDGDSNRDGDFCSNRYTLVPAHDSATGKDITITETDIDNFIRAKAAIFSGIISLLSPLGFSPVDIDNIYIAGGIGSGINIKNAISIGMLPNLPLEKYQYLGNTALDGAYSMLLPLYSQQVLDDINEIADNMTYIDLSTQPGYMDEFIAACFLPHTDERLFV